MDKVLRTESVALKVDLEPIEIEAGINQFDKFGLFNTLYSLADGDFTKIDAAFNMEYQEAFIILARKSEEVRFSRRLQKVLKKKES